MMIYIWELPIEPNFIRLIFINKWNRIIRNNSTYILSLTLLTKAMLKDHFFPLTEI